MNAKISINRQEKEKIVAELSEKLTRAKALVFTDYQGLTHKQLESLKKALKSINAELMVTKNTLLTLALKSTSEAKQVEELEGPTATVFAYDDVIPALKQIVKTIKEFSKPTLKFGILDNQALTGEQLLKLASLPSRDVLLAQVLGGLKSPIWGLHRALNWNISNLVLTLKAIETKKQLATSN